jgi:hypothetical protein
MTPPPKKQISSKQENNKYRRKRSPELRNQQLARISELMMQQYTHQEITDILAQESGIRVTRRQISRDAAEIRQNWLSTRQETYEAMVNQEMQRIDSLEKEIWKALRASIGERKKIVVEKVARALKETDDVELAVARVVESTEFADINPSFFDKIMECHKERRRILGLYAPGKLGIDVNKYETVIVKGYATVSPEDWPSKDVVDGEFTEQKKITAGDKS